MYTLQCTVGKTCKNDKYGSKKTFIEREFITMKWHCVASGNSSFTVEARGGDITYIQMERERRGAIGDKEYSRNECEIFLMKGNEGKTGGYEGFQGV